MALVISSTDLDSIGQQTNTTREVADTGPS
jgi:hypothetical protein